LSHSTHGEHPWQASPSTFARARAGTQAVGACCVTEHSPRCTARTKPSLIATSSDIPPTRALAREAVPCGLSGPEAGEYHSRAMEPRRTTRTPDVFRAANAACHAANFVESRPACAWRDGFPCEALGSGCHGEYNEGQADSQKHSCDFRVQKMRDRGNASLRGRSISAIRDFGWPGLRAVIRLT
jgi:hypothetical protein